MPQACSSSPVVAPVELPGLAILAVLTSPLTMIAGIAASSAVLVAVATADTIG